MNSQPSTPPRRPAIQKRSTGARQHSITREPLLEEVEGLQAYIEKIHEDITLDNEEMAARLSRIEVEMNHMYWYILAPCLICAAILISMVAQSLIGGYKGG